MDVYECGCVLAVLMVRAFGGCCAAVKVFCVCLEIVLSASRSRVAARSIAADLDNAGIEKPLKSARSAGRGS